MADLRLYIDNSALNRPFDDQTQPRIWLETLSVIFILTMIEAGEAEMIASEVHFLENEESADRRRQEFVTRVLTLAPRTMRIDERIVGRAEVLQRLHLSAPDALHLSAAETAASTHFITCDDRLIRRYRGKLAVTTPQAFITLLGGDGGMHED
jgi:predicted nucleic acid-binding protein